MAITFELSCNNCQAVYREKVRHEEELAYDTCKHCKEIGCCDVVRVEDELYFEVPVMTTDGVDQNMYAVPRIWAKSYDEAIAYAKRTMNRHWQVDHELVERYRTV